MGRTRQPLPDHLLSVKLFSDIQQKFGAAWLRVTWSKNMLLLTHSVGGIESWLAGGAITNLTRNSEGNKKKHTRSLILG